MEKSVMLYQFIELIIFCIPIGSLIWKAAKQNARVEDLEKRLTNLTAEVSSQKTETNKSIEEIKVMLNNLNISFVKIETSLSFIEKSIKQEGR